MSKNKIVVATDIGSSKITTLVADMDEIDNFHIIGWGESSSAGIEKGTITNPNELHRSIRESISMAENSSGFKITNIIANISGQHIDFKTELESLSFQVQGKEIDENDIATMIDNVSQKLPKDVAHILHVLPKRYILDDELVLEPVGLLGSKLDVEFNIISIKSNIYTNLKKIIESTAVEVLDFVANPIASSSAVLFEEEKDLGVACIDIGGTLSDLAICKNGTLEYLKSIPVGGNLISKDIAYKFKIPKDVAETVKKQLGIASTEYLDSDENIEIPIREDGESVSISKYEVTEIIEWRLVEILEILRKEIEKSGIYEKLNAGIVITGGVANTPFLQPLAQSVFEKDVRIGKPKGYKGFSDKFAYPDYATTVGILHFIKSYKLNNKSFARNQGDRSGGLQNIFNKFFDKIKELF